MDFPRVTDLAPLLFLIYLLIQLYLFLRIEGYLRRRVLDQAILKRLQFFTGAFFLFMLYPLALRWVFGFEVYEPFAWALRGLLAFWVVGSVGCGLILLGYSLWGRLASLVVPRPKAANPQRREFLKTALGAAAVAPFVVSGYGTIQGRHRFRMEHFSLPVEGLSSALSNLSIVQLSDIHVGPFMPEQELDRYVDAVNRSKPDLVVLTGDFISSQRDEVGPCVQALKELKARHGIFACLGNHDIFTGADEEITRQFRENGIRVLRNDAAPIRIGNTVLNVLGIDDLRWGKPSLSGALRAGRRQPGEITLLLSHRPEIFPAAAERGVDLVLSGHYHGGQIKVAPGPKGLSIARLLTPYAEGLFRLSASASASAGNHKGATLFVSRGIGITALPIRVNCPPQIAHLTLRKA